MHTHVVEIFMIGGCGLGGACDHIKALRDSPFSRDRKPLQKSVGLVYVTGS